MPPKQQPKHGSSQASSSQHAARPTHSRYYELCEHIADHLPQNFKVNRGMSVVSWSGPPAAGDSHPPVTLWVQARNHRDPKPNRTQWDVEVHKNEGLVHKIRRLVKRGFPEGPKGSVAIFTKDLDTSTEALFQFRKNKNKTKPDDPLGGDCIPEPEPPEVIIRGSEGDPLASLARFLFQRDHLFDVWECRTNSKFVTYSERPQYNLVLDATYWMVENGQRTKKVNIALYWAKDPDNTGKSGGVKGNLEVAINKTILESLIRAAEVLGTGGVGHHFDSCFMWRLEEGVQDKFKPLEILNDSSSSPSTSPCPSTDYASSAASPSPGPGPSSSQKRDHSRTGSDAADSKKRKVGTSTTFFGSRPQHTPKQTALQAQASVPVPGQPPFSDFYTCCKNIARNLQDFKVYSNAKEIAWESCPEGERTYRSILISARLIVQARHEIKNASFWEVNMQDLHAVKRELGRQIRRGSPKGPGSCFAISIQDKGEPHEVLFFFEITPGSRPPRDIPSNKHLPEPYFEPGYEGPPRVIIKNPDNPLPSLADFFLRVDHEFDIWEKHSVHNRVFVASVKPPKYNLIMSDCYTKVVAGKTTNNASIALYMAKEHSVEEETLKVIVNKELLEKLLEVAEHQPGEPGLHFKRGIFIWQYREGPEHFPKTLNYDSSASTSPGNHSSYSESSPGPDPGAGPSHPGPPSPSQKREHPGDGSDAGSKKAKHGVSSTFGIRTKGASGSTSHSASTTVPHTSASDSHQPSGSTSHSDSTSAPHTSSQHSSQHNLSDKFDKNLKN